MQTLNRRTFLRGAAFSGVAASGMYSLLACGDSNSGTSESESVTQELDWWDGSEVNAELNKTVVADADLGNVGATITYMPSGELGEALSAANQSNQLPDITSDSGLSVPAPVLVDEGWFVPLELDGEDADRLEAMGLFNGIHVFDGVPYSFNTRGPTYNMVNWYHNGIMEEAGIDPASPPTTYDEFRDVLRKVVDASDAYGALLPFGAAGAIVGKVDLLAQAAGFEGFEGRLFRTGEYAYDADPYVNAVEFLLSLKRDNLIVPGELNLDVKTGQARWAAGESAFFFDGPWLAGNVVISYPEIQGTIGAGPLLVPDSSSDGASYVPPPSGTYFVTKNAEDPELASRVLALLTTDEYQVRFAEAMGHPPRDPAVLDTADVDEVYRQVVTENQNKVFVLPEPIVRNIDVAQVDIELQSVTPGFGEIVQGYFNGDIDDLRAELTKLSDASQQELSRAIDVAVGNGAEVSMEDFAFPDWQPRTSYTADNYA